jgi:hypothetical protein
MGINGMRRARPHPRRLPVTHLLTVMAATLGVLAGPTAGALAKGGTAKPPPGGTASFTIPTLGNPAFTPAGGAADVHGFDDTGYIQSATVSDAACPGKPHPGGTVTLNGNVITIPCNTIVQMPANTLAWDEFVGTPAADEVKSFPAGSSFNSLNTYAAFELQVQGNIVGGKRIGALAFAAQQSLNGASGTIVGFDYAKGIMKIASGQADPTIVQINDPVIPGLGSAAGTGRFSAGQTPDERYSVDQENPTIHAGTGYPMCIPRTDPALKDDPLCPQVNRPKPVSAHCRDFIDAGVNPLPASGNLSGPAAGQPYCSQYVMQDPAKRRATDPDATKQAPFEVGDFVTYSGTLQHDGGADYISAHTIEANVGIYTQPGTQPAYLSIGEFGVGTADPNAVAAGGLVDQETQDRLFLETSTTDVVTPVDIYMMDVDSQSGAVRNRWVTTAEMTGTPAGAGNAAGGGIITQFAGPQPQRARIRANKAPAGLLSQPSRTVRVAQRTLCQPQAPDTSGTDPNTNELHPKLTTLDTCLDRASNPAIANGVVAGQYVAPTFEYIFPENVRPGDPIVPNDLWHLPFLRFGEGDVGPLTPAPW